MKWALLVPAVLLLAAAIAFAALTADGDRGGFGPKRAEATVRRALERCDHELRDARRIDCERAGRGFACRADGRFVASFREPDADQPELVVNC